MSTKSLKLVKNSSHSHIVNPQFQLTSKINKNELSFKGTKNVNEKSPAAQPKLPMPRNSGKGDIRPYTASLYSMNKFLENPKSTGHGFFKVLEDMREVRHTSVLQIQKALQISPQPDKEEKIEAIKWDEQIDDSAFIDVVKYERPIVKLKGRLFQREKDLININRVITDLKFERKNPGKVIKHLTNIKVDPATLAQPQYTSIETTPEQFIKEASRKQSLQRQNSHSLHVDSGLDDFRLSTVQTAGLEEENYAMSYNKEQLKKLKEGLMYVSKHQAKNHYGRLHNSTQNKDRHISSVEPQTNKEGEAGKLNETNVTEGDATGAELSFSRPKHAKKNFLRKNLVSKVKLEEMVDLQVQTTQNPREEFYKILGVSPSTNSPKNKLGFFLLTEDLNSPNIDTKANGIDNETLSPDLTRLGNTQDSLDNKALFTSFFSANKVDNLSKKMERDVFASSSMRTSVEKGHKDFRIHTRDTYNQRVSLASRSAVSRKEKTKDILMENDKPENENIKRYRLLSVECDNNIKATMTIQSTIDKNFGKLNGVLNQISEGITSSNMEVDKNIKNDIFLYMASPHHVIAGHRRKTKPKINKGGAVHCAIFSLIRAFYMDLSLSSILINSSKRETVKSTDLSDENEVLRNTIAKLTSGLATLRAESQRKTEQITELQKWTQNLVSLNSSNYESAMGKVRDGLENYFFLKEDICELKKEIMYEKRKILVTKDRYNKAKEELNKLKREMMATPSGMLFIEKINLEATLKQLSEEVEALSERNEKLLKELNIKDFFSEYEKESLEVSLFLGNNSLIIEAIQAAGGVYYFFEKDQAYKAEKSKERTNQFEETARYELRFCSEELTTGT